jgi:Arc/MetJ-type ribon-helix-helix transcriptional regulator
MVQPQRLVTLLLNQQQLELLDKTVERGIAPDRESLIRLALREFSAKHAGGGDSSRPAGQSGRTP